MFHIHYVRGRVKLAENANYLIISHDTHIIMLNLPNLPCLSVVSFTK